MLLSWFPWLLWDEKVLNPAISFGLGLEFSLWIFICSTPHPVVSDPIPDIITIQIWNSPEKTKGDKGILFLNAEQNNINEKRRDFNISFQFFEAPHTNAHLILSSSSNNWQIQSYQGTHSSRPHLPRTAEGKHDFSFFLIHTTILPRSHRTVLLSSQDHRK